MHTFSFFYKKPLFVPVPYVENAVFFPLDGFSSFVKDQVCGFIFGSSILFHWSTCLSLYQYHPVLNHNCSVIQLEVRDADSPRSSFIVENSFCYPRFLLFQMNLQIAFSNCEELGWNFDEDCIESVDCVWQDVHFYLINPANPWAWDIFPSSEIFFDFFLQRLEVLIITDLSLS